MGLRSLLVLVIVAGIGAAGVFAWARLESAAPVLTGPDAVLLGNEPREIEISVSEEGMGLKSWAAYLVTPSGETPLFADAIRGSLLEGSREQERRVSLSLDPGALGLEDGVFRLRIEAEDWSWRANRGELEIPIEVDRIAPGVSVRSGLTYVDQGGSAAVVYELSEEVARDGVEVIGEEGISFYPGYPLPGSDSESGPPGAAASGAPDRIRRVAIFAVDRNAGADASIAVVAEDRAGNESRARWNVVLRPRVFPRGNVNLPASFLRDVVPDLARQAGIDATDPVAAFERINTEMRSANEQAIRAALAESAPRPLWSGGFEQMASSKVTSRFAEARVYVVEGRPVSGAIHYGYDLASLARAEITAANSGIVRHAGDLGIYGNCVLVDHGLGVASLYGHLSRIDVREGSEVRKGERLGLSGATGLAGGDHLHFAILVGSTYVDPVEWWDAKWVREHITAEIAPESSPSR
ncbi:MAG TPA: M23 family metallopeptidase [Myxococcota bacterium]|nr:M23 family metallopeptidase [Myxococcota bacterium]